MTPAQPISFRLALLPLALISGLSQAAAQAGPQLDTVYVTAEQQLQQSLGVSKITTEDLDKRPPINDISEIVRTMPGVNLTGNTASGQHGNKRQIDIRGMGPENTLILIDGRPVTSRNSARMSWRGERNTNGDSNWVPVEDIQSIEVIRGPAAARYGSGAAGGVVNIVTKKISNEFHGALNYFTNQPKDAAEGATHRIGFNLSGPIVQDVLSYRVYGSYNKTDADSPYINNTVHSNAAGKEGLTNKDMGGRLAWRITPNQTLTLDTSYSRQGNEFNGDVQLIKPNAYNQSLYGQETMRLYRQSYALTHDGAWHWGDSKVMVQYDRTTNSNCTEGLAGGTEGACTGTIGQPIQFADSTLKTFRTSGEVNIPFTWGVGHVLTLGSEYSHDTLDDPDATKQTTPIGSIASERASNIAQNNWAIFAEDNIALSDQWKLIPALRFDHNNTAGGNWSPALNFAYQLHPNWMIKGGIARAYKAPNLYQSNDNYLLYTRGNGCPLHAKRISNCYLVGNSNLQAETSWNKELGFEFSHNGYLASLAYFRNDYKNKITAGDTVIDTVKVGTTTYNVLAWSNARKAVVEGFEGNVTLPLTDRLKWVNNFTYMKQSQNKDTGNPLAVIPKFTLNTTLSWQATDAFDTQLTFTQYGRQKPRTIAEANLEQNALTGASNLTHEELGSYGVWGVSAGYRFNKNVDMRMGMNNIFDKRIYRKAEASSAQSYNERGRAIWASMKVVF